MHCLNLAHVDYELAGRRNISWRLDLPLSWCACNLPSPCVRRVSDQGGGIPEAHAHRVWEYGFTTLNRRKGLSTDEARPEGLGAAFGGQWAEVRPQQHRACRALCAALVRRLPRLQQQKLHARSRDCHWCCCREIVFSQLHSIAFHI